MLSMAPQRVILFLDEKNIYMEARRAFFEWTDQDRLEGVVKPHHTRGQFHPIDLAELICSRLPYGVTEERKLREVRLYTGRPSATYEPKTYGAHMKQCLSWEAAGVTVIHRPLRYLSGHPPAQKGVDVALALDFVIMAIEGEYDIGIIFSTDTDLRPALEFIASRGCPKGEVACWWSDRSQSYLSISNAKVWSHRLTEQAYKSICDYTDYNKS